MKDPQIEKLQCELRDRNGDIVKLGDEIIVLIPEVHIPLPYEEEDYWLPELKVRAELKLRLSTGLCVKVLDILEGKESDFIKIGRTIHFKRKAWEWSKSR